MKIIRPSAEFISIIDREAILKHIEICGRVAYKSEDKITPDSAAKFVSHVVKRKHLSVIEHVSLTARIITDRGVTHEAVRHRLASFTQESTRYVNYGNRGGEITVIAIDFSTIPEEATARAVWESAIESAEAAYMSLLDLGCSPQIARDVLPTCTKAEIIVTANLREWRHILDLRTAPDAHPKIRTVMLPLLCHLNEELPEIFGDLVEKLRP